MRSHSRKVALIAAIASASALLFPAAAQATARITKAEMNATQLRVEGTANPNAVITINGVAMGTSDANGNFKIEKDPYTPPADCVVQVNDGSPTATKATLAGCTAASSSSTSTSPTSTSTPALAKVIVNPSDVIGGDSSSGTVTLTAAAPAGGVQIPLSSDDPAAASVPASVTVLAGATSASFPITTYAVANPQSSLIIGSAGGVTTYGIITVYTPFTFANGNVSLVRGGNGNGTITSQPAGIDCTISSAGGSGTCGAWFPVGTVVKLDARPASDSSFIGWGAGIGCGNPSKLVAQRDEFISCQPDFVLK
jgi:hypothetical protein